MIKSAFQINYNPRVTPTCFWPLCSNCVWPVCLLWSLMWSPIHAPARPLRVTPRLETKCPLPACLVVHVLIVQQCSKHITRFYRLVDGFGRSVRAQACQPQQSARPLVIARPRKTEWEPRHRTASLHRHARRTSGCLMLHALTKQAHVCLHLNGASHLGL
jgi:hypothetical protein